MTNDPIAQFRRWFAMARRNAVQPEAMALATADRRGRPSVRFVLLKQADARGFVFYSNERSRKGKQLDANPYAALAIHWQPLGKQVRVDGRVERVGDAEADAYWQSRPRESQLAALASQQSAVLGERSDLVARWKQLHSTFRDRPVPRPAHWRGFCLVPQRIEFWTRREHRLHDRELFVRTQHGWKRTLLQP